MRQYVIPATNLTLAGAVTMFFINPGTTASIAVTRIQLGQNGTATSGQCRIQLVRQVSAFPTLTSATPQRIDPRDAASVIVGGTAGAAGTCGINASAEGAGAKTVIEEASFNNLNGLLWVPSPGEEIILPASATSGFGVYFAAAPASLTGWGGGLWFREL